MTLAATVSRLFLAGFVAAITGLSPVAFAQGLDAASEQSAIERDIEAYCGNIADAARDQRYALQRQDLETLQGEIDDRIAVLEARRAEYEDWLTRRNDFLKLAEDGLVDIYKGMRPDAAAERLELVSAEVAAAILMKLNPRMAGQILNEMDTKVAATLTSVIASAGDETTSRNPT
ncbi:MotE family protein [Pararhizobium haloflavum]|uniref:MotE family protein n=1 Tax=Pararhizobium haloflavum TaxID=2037914 RepID=UPI000C186675|nr:MotE family protein [Pararhizobium haloflavum]